LDGATQITPQQIEAEETAKLNSSLNTNLRATTTWKIQNNDGGNEHPDSETMCGVHIRGKSEQSAPLRTTGRSEWQDHTGTSTITDKGSQHDGKNNNIEA
jgi:hypothetical protein